MRLANISYDLRDDRFAWQMSRFRIGFEVDPRKYPFGPANRDHGLDHRVFLDPLHREFILSNATHAFMRTSFGPFDGSLFPVLFLEAMALPDMPPQPYP